MISPLACNPPNLPGTACLVPYSKQPVTCAGWLSTIQGGGMAAVPCTKGLTPVGWSVSHQTSEAFLQFLIEPLSLSIWLWVATWTQAQRCPHQGTKSLPKSGNELRTSIRDYINGKTCRRTTFLKNTSAVSYADSSLGKGIKWPILENLLNTVRSTLCPYEMGSLVVKSRKTWTRDIEG